MPLQDLQLQLLSQVTQSTHHLHLDHKNRVPAPTQGLAQELAQEQVQTLIQGLPQELARELPQELPRELPREVAQEVTQEAAQIVLVHLTLQRCHLLPINLMAAATQGP